MARTKIVASLIVLGTGNDAQNLRRCLTTVAPYVDGIYITLTGPKKEIKETEKVCREFKVNISYYRPFFTVTKKVRQWMTDFLTYEPHIQAGDRLFLFDEARNFNFSQIPKEYDMILWIDCDDILIGGKNLWKIKEIVDQTGIDAFLLKYIYLATFDKNNSVKEILIEHIRERIVRNGAFKWIAPIHEVLDEVRPTTKTYVEDCCVLHLINMDHIQKGIQRNMKNLEYAVFKSNGIDPRHLYNLAKGYIDMKNPEYTEKAIPLLKAFLWGKYQSNWPEERAEAYEYLGSIYKEKKEFNEAIKACILGLNEEPQRRSLFLNLASIYAEKEEWGKAIWWVKLADKFVDKKTTLTINPREMELRRLVILYNAYFNLGEVDKAYEMIFDLLKLAPNDPIARETYINISKKKSQNLIAEGFALSLQASGEEDKAKELLEVYNKRA